VGLIPNQFHLLFGLKKQVMPFQLVRYLGLGPGPETTQMGGKCTSATFGKRK